MKKYFKLILVFVLIIILGIKLYYICNLANGTVLAGILIAYLVGVLSIFQNEIRNWVFRPILTPCIKVSETTTTDGVLTKYYNLNIKNEGFIVAKNIRVKIKSEKDKEWLNLQRPFYVISQSIFIKTLSSQEEENFNIGNINKNENIFRITTDIIANNQKLRIDNGENQMYYLEIISENTKPISLKININNKGFDYNNIILLIN